MKKYIKHKWFASKSGTENLKLMTEAGETFEMITTWDMNGQSAQGEPRFYFTSSRGMCSDNFLSPLRCLSEMIASANASVRCHRADKLVDGK